MTGNFISATRWHLVLPDCSQGRRRGGSDGLYALQDNFTAHTTVSVQELLAKKLPGRTMVWLVRCRETERSGKRMDGTQKPSPCPRVRFCRAADPNRPAGVGQYPVRQGVREHPVRQHAPSASHGGGGGGGLHKLAKKLPKAVLDSLRGDTFS